MEEIHTHGIGRKKSLYVFAGLFITVLILSIWVLQQYLAIPLTQQTIGLVILFLLFIAFIGIGFHHKKLRFAHAPMFVGLILIVIGGSLVYGAVNPNEKWWILAPEQIGMFAIMAIGGLVLFALGTAQAWKKTNA